MAFDTDSHAALAALIDYAKQAGASGSEASLTTRESISAEVRMGDLEGMEREEARSVALRAFIGKQQAAASSTDLSAKGLKDLAERTVAMAKAAPEDKFAGLLDARFHAKGPAPDLEQSDTARPTPEQLLDLAFDGGKDVFDRAVDTQVSRLRRKIEADARSPKLIKTVWGGGYVFTAPVEKA